MIDAPTYGKPSGSARSDIQETTSPAEEASSSTDNCRFRARMTVSALT
jgi:hypothetical protein